MSTEERTSGRRALVTGAGTGIGPKPRWSLPRKTRPWSIAAALFPRHPDFLNARSFK
jgi:hypothetical protein